MRTLSILFRSAKAGWLVIPLVPRGHLGTEGVKEEEGDCGGGGGDMRCAWPGTQHQPLWMRDRLCSLWDPTLGLPAWLGVELQPPLAQPHPQILGLERWSPQVMRAEGGGAPTLRAELAL